MSKSQMRAAKKAQGICTVHICGSKAFLPWEKCQNHVTTTNAIWAVHQTRRRERDDKLEKAASTSNKPGKS